MDMSLKDFFMVQHDGARSMAGAGVIGMHLVSGPLVGFAIGYGLDCWLDSGPIAGLIGLVIGILAGFLNVYRDSVLLLKKMDNKRGAPGAAPPAGGAAAQREKSLDSTGQASAAQKMANNSK